MKVSQSLTAIPTRITASMTVWKNSNVIRLTDLRSVFLLSECPHHPKYSKVDALCIYVGMSIMLLNKARWYTKRGEMMCPTVGINLTCPECGGQIYATVYVEPGSLGREYHYETGRCGKCQKEYEPSEVE